MLANGSPARMPLTPLRRGRARNCCARPSERLAPLIEATLADAECGWTPSTRIAGPLQPGLIGRGMVGLVTAKALAMAADKPCWAMNHPEGHAPSPRLADATLNFPPAAGFGRALPVAGGRGVRALSSAGDDHRRCAGRAAGQDGETVGAGYPGGRRWSGWRPLGTMEENRCRAPCWGARSRISACGAEKRGVARARYGVHTDADIAASFQQAAIDSA